MRSVHLIAAISLLATAAGCRPGRSAEVREVVPELTREGVRFAIERGGQSRAWGVADQLTYRRDTTAAVATGLKFVMTGPEGEVRITAPRGSGVASDRHFDFEGGLQATRGADVASTASAHYDSPQNGAGQVAGSEPVVVNGPGYRLFGKGFRLNPASGEIVLLNGARLVAGLPVTP
jgi:hypothetical protein